MITLNMKQNRPAELTLLNYEDFKIFTLSPAYSLICMTSLTKTIGHIYGPWAISVPDMYPTVCIVIEILHPQASRINTHTHTYTHRYVLPT